MSEEEKKYLLESPACNICGHAVVIHNFHCCEFCSYPGCNCEPQLNNSKAYQLLIKYNETFEE